MECSLTLPAPAAVVGGDEGRPQPLRAEVGRAVLCTPKGRCWHAAARRGLPALPSMTGPLRDEGIGVRAAFPLLKVLSLFLP